ncbi:MAG: mechanosensitive ion channel [Rickettsiales bacterium]|nr:mechanosensitive ion channel [Rickettsiales bacterium]
MKNEISFDQIFAAIEKAISSSSFYWQSLSLLGCFLISFLFYKLSRKFLLPALIASSLKKNIALNRLVTRYLIPLLYPIFAVAFLGLGLSIYSEFFKEAIVFETTLKLIALFLFLRFLRISSNNTFITNLAGFFLMPALVLDIFGLLDSAIILLDEYAFKIGAVRISAYLVIKAIIVLMLVFWLSTFVSKKSKSFLDNSKSIKSSTKGIISKFIDIFVYSVVAIVLLKTFSVDMTTFAVIGGAVGVGIGFGLQKIASNFISGIILLFEKSVEIGDIVEIDNANIYGTVKHFGGRYTLVEAVDGKEIMIPNEDFIIGKVTNWTYSNNRARVEINVGVAYGSDLEKVREIMMNCAKENPRCLSYPDAECFATSFGDYDIKFTLYFWISDIVEGRMRPKSEVIISIWEKFRENKIEIPLPQREIKNITSE